MNIKQYMKLRLIFPLILLILGTIFKQTTFIFAGMAIGYLLCWIFSYIAICRVIRD